MVQTPARQAESRPVAAGASLSALEWSIVALAERDQLSSVNEPGRFLTALNGLFGLKPPNRLANPRLEALRRMAVFVWHHRWNVPESELQDFLSEGFSIEQYELIQRSVAKARTSRASGAAADHRLPYRLTRNAHGHAKMVADRY